MLVPFQIRKKGNPEISLCINVLHNFTIDSVFGYNGMMLSCDAEYFTCLGIEFNLLLKFSLQLRAHFSTFLVLRAHASAGDSATEKHFVSSANKEIPTGGEDIDDGRSFT